MEKQAKDIIEEIKAEIRKTAEEESDERMWSRGLLYSLVIISKHMKAEEPTEE